MTSRLLHDLQARIASARDPVRNACLRAEHATVLARHGLLEQARAELDLIRARHAAAPHAVITAWVCLGEGMVVLYDELTPRARDKFLRAYALASACGEIRVRSMSAAWLSHLDYVDQNFSSMTRYAEIALAECPHHDDSIRARVCLVVAQTFHWCDRFDLARAWYERARQHAVSLGDEAFVSALMHNMAWLNVAQARMHVLSAGAACVKTSHMLLGAESTQSFDRLSGIASLGSLVPILRAHALSLLDRHEEALEQFEAHLGSALKQGLSRIECSVLAEMAWCQLNCGKQLEARSTAAVAATKLDACLQSDERAVTYGRLAQCFRMWGDEASASAHSQLSIVEWAKHGRLTMETLSVLGRSELLSGARRC